MKIVRHLTSFFVILGLTACGSMDRKPANSQPTSYKLDSEELSDSQMTSHQRKQVEVIQKLSELLKNKKHLGNCLFKVDRPGIINPQFTISDRDGRKQYISVVISPELKMKQSPVYGAYYRMEEEYGIVYNLVLTGQGARTIDFYLDDSGQVASIVGRKWTKILGVWTSEKLVACQ